MSRDSFNYTHGDLGNKPNSGVDFQKDTRPDSEEFDWFWYHVIEAIKGHASEFDRLDNDDDGVVDAADGASTWSDSGSVEVTHPTDVDFVNNLTVTDDGDGTLSIDTIALNESEVENTIRNVLVDGNSVSFNWDSNNRELTIKVDESQISHDNLSNINSDDHHTKTTTQGELTDFSSDAENIYVSSTEPSNPSAGDLWIDTS